VVVAAEVDHLEDGLSHRTADVGHEEDAGEIHDRGHGEGSARAHGPRGHAGRDGVGGVMRPVHQKRADAEHDDDGQSRVGHHSGEYRGQTYVRHANLSSRVVEDGLWGYPWCLLCPPRARGRCSTAYDCIRWHMGARITALECAWRCPRRPSPERDGCAPSVRSSLPAQREAFASLETASCRSPSVRLSSRRRCAPRRWSWAG